MQIFLSAFKDVPDPRASNARHDLGELLVISFVSVICGSSSCAEMAAFGRAKEHLFRDFLKLKCCPRHSVEKSGTGQSRPASRSRLANIPAVWRNGNLNRTLIDKQNCMAASENTAGRPGRPSGGARQVMSLSTQMSKDPRFLSDAL